MDSAEEKKIEKKVKKNTRQTQISIKARNSVSAEVYGIFNKKNFLFQKKYQKQLNK